MGIGDNCYLNFVPFTMDDFEPYLYIYYLNRLNLYPRIQMKLKSRIVDPV